MKLSKVTKYAGACVLAAGLTTGGVVLAQGQGGMSGGSGGSGNSDTSQRSDNSGHAGWLGLLGLVGLAGLRRKNNDRRP